MRLRRATIVVLVTAAVWAQGMPATASAGQAVTNQWSRGIGRKRGLSATAERGMAATQSSAAIEQRLEEMEGTLTKMHALLKQMHTKVGKSGAKDPLAKASLDMWELMLGHMDKQFQELKIATTARQDMEARRAAMYKQGDAKPEAAAQAARAAQAVGAAHSADQAPTPATAVPGTGQSTASQSAAGQTSPAPPSSASPPAN